MFRCGFWSVVVAIFVFAPAVASAHTVVVDPPDRTDQKLVESFGRLCGELSMYGLDVKPTETAPRDAIGGVALVRSVGQLSARIWITAATESDKVVQITITVPDTDAPSLLAIRAADVLRASLRDYRGLALLPPPAAAVAVASPSPSRNGQTPSWSVVVSAATLFDPGAWGLGFGPSLQLRRRLGNWLSVMLDVTGPVVGHAIVSSAGSAHVREALATTALAARLADGSHVTLDLLLALGPLYLAVHGNAQAPWTPQDSSAWAAVSGGGARLTVRLTNRLALSASSTVLFILPRPVVDLGAGSYPVGQPLLQSSLGLDLAL